MKSTDKQICEVLCIPGPKRVNYFHGLLLSADELQKEQDYFINKLRQHNRAIFNPGIIKGLTLECTGQLVSVSSGFAMDSSGRLIELSTSYNFNLPEKNGSWEIILELIEEKCDPCPYIGPASNDNENEFEESSIQEITKIWARDIKIKGVKHTSDIAIFLGQIEIINGKLKIEKQ